METVSWAVLTSLRSVDADAALRIDEDWLPARAGAPTHAPPATAAQENIDQLAEEAWWTRSLFVTPLRRAHVIAPFGRGSLLLTRNRISAVVCGLATRLRSLPSRPPGSVLVLDELTISDRHLQTATGVERFVMPWAAGDNPSRDHDWLLPAVRFPLSEACSNPGCQRLTRRNAADANEGRCDACSSPNARRGRWPFVARRVRRASRVVGRGGRDG